MELKFLGRGAGFNILEGNTSAYFIDSGELFLIDCGEDSFGKLLKRDILTSVSAINVIITHTHSDHVGSLGNLILYSYYTLKIPVKIICSNKGDYIKNDIIKLLDIFGCASEMYSITYNEEYDNKYKTFNSFSFEKTYHGDILSCFSVVFLTNDGIVYYSGDSASDFFIKYAIESNSRIDKMYVDVTSDELSSKVHLNINKLHEVVPKDWRNKIYCMHFNNQECLNKAIEFGFNVAEVEKND